MEVAILSSPASPVAAPAGREADRRALTVSRVLLAGIVAAAAALRFSRFGSVAPNPYYDAAVRSMSQSWHNLFFGAFEPGGAVSVDKVPVDLWLQVLSVKLFGFSSSAVRIPEAVCATLAVGLLYDVVRRVGGRAAGLASAAALAVLPAAVLTGRSDTMDSAMMLALVLAAWLAVRAAQTGRGLWLAGAGAALGLAFNLKLFEALVAAPALLILHWLGSPGDAGARARRLGGAALAFAVAALAWIVAASASPGPHPFPIGSTNGSVWNVVFVFNGSSRIGSNGTPVPRPPLDRLFANASVDYGHLIGFMLAAAVAVGLLAVVAWWPRIVRDRRAGEGRLLRAGVAAAAAWLVTGTVLFTAVARLHPRYLEAMTPAVATVLGCAAVALAARLATLAPVRARPTVAGVATVAVLGALLAGPASDSLSIVSSGRSDAGHPGHIAPASLTLISRYLRAHSPHTRYEAAVSSAFGAAPLIVRDGRPVLVLTTLYGHQLTTITQLRAASARGEVRYALLRDGSCHRGMTRSPACAPAVRWIRARGIDVSRHAGFPHRGVLYRLPKAGAGPQHGPNLTRTGLQAQPVRIEA
jgi:4-amino-4-deoxy-L-arabinose transferase-like glycosyltransferase